MYAGRCYGYFYRLTGDRDLSDELLSELFIRLVEKIGSYKGGAFESWLFKIASNIFHDHLRGKQRRREAVGRPPDPIGIGAGPERAAVLR